MKDIKVTISCKDESKLNLCKKCGDKVEVNTSMAYCSDPPMYGTFCPNCGNTGYINCSEYNPDGIIRKQISIVELKELLDKVGELK